MIKRLMWIAVLVALLTMLFGSFAYAKGRKSSGGSTHVKGYTKKNGTYVAPHNRTKPDKSKSNNWSSEGNTNPYTGKQGKKKP